MRSSHRQPRAVYKYWVGGPECSAFWPVWTRRTIAAAWTLQVLLVILHLALFLLFFMVVSVFCAMLGSPLDTCSWVRCTQFEREVQRNVCVHSSSCGAHRDVVHSPFGWFYHRCHCNCRGFVLFVGRLPWLCGPFLLRECLRRDVVWWWILLSWWCLRFFLGQCEADGWKIPHQLFPVPRGCWVCMHAEILVQQHERNLPRQLLLFPVQVDGQVSQSEVGGVSVR